MKAPLAQLRTSSPRTRRAIGIAAGAVLCLAIVPAVSNASANEVSRASKVGSHDAAPGNFDSRADANPRGPLAARRAALAANPGPGVRRLRAQLGMQGIVDIDPITATPRTVKRLDGFLTATSVKSPARVALDFVSANADAFGLSTAQIGALTLRQDYVDVEGTHHLSFTQNVGGVTVFGNGLKAHVTRDGRLVQVDGSPVATLPASLGSPSVSATQARDTAVGDAFGTSQATVAKTLAGAARQTEFTGGDQAQLVAFQTLGGTRLAWQTITLREGFIHVVDAQTGRVLFRQSMVAKDTGQAWNNYPSAPKGGNQKTRDFTDKGWLPHNSANLNGNIGHVYLDINDSDTADAGEEVPPSSSHKYNYPFTAFSGPSCSAAFPCAWDPTVPFSWQTNQNQDATQMFFFLGNYHDHLKANPIGFTRAAGNFEAVDGDAVQGNAIDGANTLGNGFPDGNHVDNANMSTPPDGIPPRMQMYLFVDPSDPGSDPFVAGNSGDEADVVYHEYTHGLSNRLVVDATGVSTLGNIQAGSMGEAWSDWYAMDFLVNDGFFTDTNNPGEIRIGQYVGAGQDLIRTQPLDCPVGTTSTACPGTPGAGPGGYTYGDFGRIIGRPEVHADGEIWGETLWDLRKSLGSSKAESLVTRAMELSPNNPSFLDMRNSILMADQVVNSGTNQKKVWQVFAARGMGWFAGAIDGDDAAPAEDFSTPPPANTPRGTLTGTVRNADTGTPVSGAIVAFGGHSSGFAGDYAATTNGSGVYTISGIIPGTYPKVFARSAGFDPVSQTVSVPSHTVVLNWALRRDWAALAGGATVDSFNGDDFTAFGCGASSMFDQSQGNGWSTDATYTAGVIDPRFVVVKLPAAVDIAELQINPANTCGDGGSASTGDYTVETSPDGTTWTSASTGHFGIADRHMHAISLSAGTTGVLYVRYTMRSAQVTEAGGNPATCPGAPFSGCLFVDSVELAVYGSPS